MVWFCFSSGELNRSPMITKYVFMVKYIANWYYLLIFQIPKQVLNEFFKENVR